MERDEGLSSFEASRDLSQAQFLNMRRHYFCLKILRLSSDKRNTGEEV